MVCIVKKVETFLFPKFPGEHVLSFAACAGNEDIISMIIDAGASTRVQDYRGALHLFRIYYILVVFCLLLSARILLFLFSVQVTQCFTF